MTVSRIFPGFFTKFYVDFFGNFTLTFRQFYVDFCILSRSASIFLIHQTRMEIRYRYPVPYVYNDWSYKQNMIVAAGVPGTGKTATVKQVMRYMLENKEDFPEFTFHEINGMRLTCPEQVTQLYCLHATCWITGMTFLSSHSRDQRHAAHLSGTGRQLHCIHATCWRTGRTSPSSPSTRS